MPISIRAGTNLEEIFYEAMVARLAAILRESPPPSADRYHTRERMKGYLARFTDPAKPCLVVIDGLDEATGWAVSPAMLPLKPPAGLRVVVSARQLLDDDRDRGWRGRLGWTDETAAESLEVLPLGEAGISDVLARMGLEAVARDREIISRLYRLTERGEPLLVELYATDLRDPSFVERLHRTDVNGLTPGLTGFFERWFADQQVIWREAKLPIVVDEVYLALTILAGAVGALRLIDIADIAKHLGMTVGAGAVSAIERFVVRFGRAASAATQTFVLTHPRLGEFLWRQSVLTQIYVSKVEKAFLDWGAAAVAAVNSEGGDPAQVPYYLLVYYLQHLRRSPTAPLERFRALADDGWRRACLDHGGGEGSLAEQLDTCLARLVAAGRANPAALQAPRTGLGGMIHIALCLASLRSLGSSFTPKIMAEMVRVDLLQPRRALFLSRVRRASERAAIIGALAPVFSDGDLPLLQAEAGQIGAVEHRVTALLAVARREPRGIRLSTVLEAMMAGASQPDEASRLESIRECLTLAGEFDLDEEESAFAAAEPLIGREHLPPRRSRVERAPEAAAPMTRSAASPRPELPPREFRADFSPPDFVLQLPSWTFRDLAGELKAEFQRLAGVSAAEATPSDLQAALNLTFALEPYHRVRLMGALAPFLDAPLLDQAIDRAVGHRNDLWFPELILPLAVRLDRDALIALLKRLLDALSDQRVAVAVKKLLPLVTDEQFELLWPCLLKLSPSHFKISVLETLVDRINPHQLDLLVDAAIPSDGVDSVAASYRADEIGLFIGRLSASQLGRLYGQTLTTESVDEYGYLLREIAPKLSPNLLEAAINDALAKKSDFYRNSRLERLLPVAAEPDPGIIDRVLAVAEAMPSHNDRLSLLELLLPHLSIERRREVLLEQRQHVFAINDRPAVTISLAALDEMPDLTDTAAFADSSEYNRSGSICLAFLPLLPRTDPDRARDAVQLAEDRLDALDDSDRRLVTLLIALCPKLSPIKGAKAARAVLDLLDNPKLSADEFGLTASLVLFSPYLTTDDAQKLLTRLAAIMRDPAADADSRLIVAVFLAEAPPVSNKLAFEAIEFIETTIADATTSALTRTLLLAALSLCRRFDSGHTPPRASAELPPVDAEEERNFQAQDLARFGGLAYRAGADLRAHTLELVERLARMERAMALLLIAMIEGSWGDAFKLGLSSGGAKRVLERVGGHHAVTDTIGAIRSVAAWWP